MVSAREVAVNGGWLVVVGWWGTAGLVGGCWVAGDGGAGRWLLGE